MVCPFIPVITMPDNSDLTVGAGLAYSLKFTDSNTHKISVDTIPENGYGWDAHLRLFVNNASLIQFMPPLNLLDPLTPNAGQNLTVKFRSGQANVYVDDIDVGYVVTVDGGTENGSLFYGINNTTDEYIVFSNALDGSVVELAGGTIGRALHVVGNGSDKTIVQSDDLGFNAAVSGTLVSFTNIAIKDSMIRSAALASSSKVKLDNVVIDGCTSDSIYVLHSVGLNGTTVSNCTFTVENPWGIDLRDSGVIANSLFTNNTSNTRFLFSITAANTTNTISGSTFSNNSAYSVDVYGLGTTNITGCTFSNNPGLYSEHIAMLVSTTDGYAAKAVLSDNVIDRTNIRVAGNSDGTVKATLTFSGVNILNSTVSGAGNIVFANGSTVTSTGDGSEGRNRGCIDLSKQTTTRNIPSSTINNIVITGYSNTAGALHVNGSNEVLFIGCTISNNVNTSPGGVGGALQVADSTYFPKVTLKDCLVTGNTAVQYGALATRYGASLIVDHCEITNNLGRSNGGPLGAVGGSSNHPDHIDIVNCYIHGNTCSNSYGQSIYVGGWADISITGTTMDCSLGIAPTMVDANSVIVISFKGDNVWTSDAPSLIKTYLRLADNANITGVTKIHSLSNVIYAEYGISVGSYNADATVYAVGGTASVTVNGHSLSLSGIGTYINSDGTNDFTTPYMVVNTSSSGSGSLLNGINDTTSTYVVIDHSVTDTSAVVNGDVTGKEKRFTCGDGRTIVGGTFSLVEGTTVSAHCDVDEHGAHVVSGSTISILGGTPTFSGNCIVGGTLLLGENATLANGTTITGVAGGEITGTINTRLLNTRTLLTMKNTIMRDCVMQYGKTNNQTVTLTGVTFTGGRDDYGVIFGSGGSGANVTLINCKITGCTGRFARVQCNGNGTSVTLDGCEIERNVVLHHDNNTKYIYIKNTNKLGRISCITSDAKSKGYIRIYKDSVLNFSMVNDINTALYCATSAGAYASVGTLTNGEWVEGGTCAVILNGTTHHVSGQGTFINKNGTGDWTDFTIID